MGLHKIIAVQKTDDVISESYTLDVLLETSMGLLFIVMNQEEDHRSLHHTAFQTIPEIKVRRTFDATTHEEKDSIWDIFECFVGTNRSIILPTLCLMILSTFELYENARSSVSGDNPYEEALNRDRSIRVTFQLSLIFNLLMLIPFNYSRLYSKQTSTAFEMDRIPGQPVTLQRLMTTPRLIVKHEAFDVNDNAIMDAIHRFAISPKDLSALNSLIITFPSQEAYDEAMKQGEWERLRPKAITAVYEPSKISPFIVKTSQQLFRTYQNLICKRISNDIVFSGDQVEEPEVPELLGRMRILEDIKRILKNQSSVVLYGPPGTGKSTAMALANDTKRPVYAIRGQSGSVEFATEYSIQMKLWPLMATSSIFFSYLPVTLWTSYAISVYNKDFGVDSTEVNHLRSTHRSLIVFIWFMVFMFSSLMFTLVYRRWWPKPCELALDRAIDPSEILDRHINDDNDYYPVQFNPRLKQKLLPKALSGGGLTIENLDNARPRFLKALRVMITESVVWFAGKEYKVDDLHVLASTNDLAKTNQKLKEANIEPHLLHRIYVNIIIDAKIERVSLAQLRHVVLSWIEQECARQEKAYVYELIKPNVNRLLAIIATVSDRNLDYFYLNRLLKNAIKLMVLKVTPQNRMNSEILLKCLEEVGVLFPDFMSAVIDLHEAEQSEEGVQRRANQAGAFFYPKANSLTEI